MPSRRSSLALATALTASLVLAACGGTGSAADSSAASSDPGLRVVASTDVWGSIARSVPLPW